MCDDDPVPAIDEGLLWKRAAQCAANIYEALEVVSCLAVKFFTPEISERLHVHAKSHPESCAWLGTADSVRNMPAGVFYEKFRDELDHDYKEPKKVAVRYVAEFLVLNQDMFYHILQYALDEDFVSNTVDDVYSMYKKSALDMFIERMPNLSYPRWISPISERFPVARDMILFIAAVYMTVIVDETEKLTIFYPALPSIDQLA